MTEFKKAYLEEVSTKPVISPKAESAKVEVQINPATLRYQMASTVDFGKDAGRYKTTYQGSTATLSFDLVFDTADEGTTKEPVDVRTRTRKLERFVLPSNKQSKAAPPRLRFTYGTFTVIGVMTVLNQDFDLFSVGGVPLRAKCAVTIKEQKPEFDASRAGPGANTGMGATQPVSPAAGAGSPGGAGAGTPPPAPADRTGTALAGESAPDFAQRMGLDPRAWKGLQGISDPLRLQPGQQIDFSSSLSPGAGLGVEVGATADLGAAASLAGSGGPGGAGGLRGPGTADGPVPARLPVDGPGLTAAGGLARALDRMTAATAASAVGQARQAFAAGSGPSPAGPSPGGPSPAAAVTTADPRAASYGFGVPLRPRLGVTGPTTAGLVRELHRNVASGGDQPPQTSDPTVPGWLALSAAGLAAGSPSAAGCGCGGCP
ncbi:MAG TPA: hypothetical protein VFV73_15465 [Streptosporangiaceae bacterium]|nr:hypothetical protein [Streptosporangiaceae bacterium]